MTHEESIQLLADTEGNNAGGRPAFPQKLTDALCQDNLKSSQDCQAPAGLSIEETTAAGIQTLAAAQLLFSFPGTPTNDQLGEVLRLPSYHYNNGLDTSSPSVQAGSMLLRSATRKRSRLQYRSSDGCSDGLFAPANNQPSSGGSDSEADPLTEVDAAYILLHMSRLQQSWEPRQIHKPSPSTLKQVPSAFCGNPAVVAATATAALATNTTFTAAQLAIGAACLAQHFFSKQAALNAAAAGLASASFAHATPNALFCNPRSSTAHTPGCTTPFSTSPFATFSSLPQQPPCGDDSEAEPQDDTAAFASTWTQQHMAKRPAIRTRGIMHQHSPLSAAPWAAAAAAAAAGDGKHWQPLCALTGTPGGLVQRLHAPTCPITPATNEKAGAPSVCSGGDASSSPASFASAVAEKVSDELQAALRNHWAATGRVAVSCGPYGKKGLGGIFTLDQTGKPVIWAPKNSAAAARLSSVEAAGGSSEVPAGFEQLEPKVFEERAGMKRTRNWQLSIVLKDYFMEPTARNRHPPVKLGIFVRVVGIPTSKAFLQS